MVVNLCITLKHFSSLHSEPEVLEELEYTMEELKYQIMSELQMHPEGSFGKLWTTINNAKYIPNQEPLEEFDIDELFSNNTDIDEWISNDTEKNFIPRTINIFPDIQIIEAEDNKYDIDNEEEESNRVPPYLDCYDAMNKLKYLFKPGNYVIYENPEEIPLNPKLNTTAYCLHDGWTVIQSRGQFGNPSDYFNKTWTEFQAGFGTPGKEQWLGLDHIYKLTNRKKNQSVLKIILERFSGETETLLYRNFRLEDQVTYPLSFGSYRGKANFANLNGHKGMSFSTYDRDNDRSPNGISCAQQFGPWWHHACLDSNLNGLNFGVDSKGKPISDPKAMHWNQFGEWNESLKSVKMAIKPLHFK